MSRRPASHLRLALVGLALPTLLAACSAGEPIFSNDRPELEITAGLDEPTTRDPLGGYTGFPIDNNPYTSDLGSGSRFGPDDM